MGTLGRTEMRCRFFIHDPEHTVVAVDVELDDAPGGGDRVELPDGRTVLVRYVAGTRSDPHVQAVVTAELAEP